MKGKFEANFFCAMQIALIVGIFLVPITIFGLVIFLTFKGNIQGFGVIGDFIGGVLNPIIAFISLVVSIFVGIQVKLLTEATIDSAEKIAQSSLDNDQRIAERQIKYQEYLTYMAKVDQSFGEWEADKYDKEKFDKFDK